MSLPAIPSDALYSSPRYKTYATVADDIDLVALGGGPCRRILVLGDGDLELVPASPLEGQTSDTIASITAGTQIDVQATKILNAGTTATKLTIFW